MMDDLVMNTSWGTSANSSNNTSDRPCRQMDDVFSSLTATRITRILECYIFPIVTIFGVTGNVLSLIVLFNLKMSSSMVILLLGLTVSDGLFLVSNMVRKSVCIIQFFDEPLAVSFGAYSFQALFYMKTSFGRVSSLLTMVISIERFIAVGFPFQVRRFSTKTKMVVYVICVFVFTFGLLSLMPALTTVAVIHGKPYVTYSQYYKNNAQFMSMLIFRWIPKFVIILLNVWIVVMLLKRKSVCASQGLLGKTGISSNENRATRMRMVVVLVFVVCLIPGDIHLVASSVIDGYSIRQRYRNAHKVFSDISLLSEMINSSVNFIIYMALSRTYSSVYRSLFCACGLPDNRRKTKYVRFVFHSSSTHRSSDGDNVTRVERRQQSARINIHMREMTLPTFHH